MVRGQLETKGLRCPLCRRFKSLSDIGCAGCVRRLGFRGVKARIKRQEKSDNAPDRRPLTV